VGADLSKATDGTFPFEARQDRLNRGVCEILAAWARFELFEYLSGGASPDDPERIEDSQLQPTHTYLHAHADARELG